MSKQQRTQYAYQKSVKRAANLSHKHDGDAICKRLGISRITLKRYIQSPLWTELGGTTRPLFPVSGPKGGRPSGIPTLTPAEKRILKKAEALRDKGLKWGEIADQLGIHRDKLYYLRKKGESSNLTK